MQVFLDRSLLITRPLQESKAFSMEIKNFDKSINTICSPLFEVENFPISQEFPGIAGAIITSSNAIRSLVHSRVIFQGLMFCVGDATASLARDSGYNSISSNGNINSLAKFLVMSVSNGLEKLIYFRGEQISMDLGKSLREKSYNVDEVICYRKLPEKLPNSVLAGIEKGLIVGATFFSKQTVKLFFSQIKKLPNGFIVFCISKEVSLTLAGLYPKSRLVIRVAGEPSAKGMYKLIVAASELVA